MKLLSISLEQDRYHPGDTAKGEVTLELDSPLALRALWFLAKGIETTEIKTSGPVFSDEPVPERLREQRSILGHKEKLEGEGTFGPGAHRFPFSFDIPKDALASYGGKMVDIDYSVKAWIDAPGAADVEDWRPFLVLQRPPNYRKLRTHHLLSTLPCPEQGRAGFSLLVDPEDRNATAMLVAMEKKVFLAGEPLNCRLLVANPGRKRLRKLVVTLSCTEQVEIGFHRESSFMGSTTYTFDIGSRDEHYRLDLGIGVPEDAPGSQVSQNFWVGWTIQFQLDVAFAYDLSLVGAVTIHQPDPQLVRGLYSRWAARQRLDKFRARGKKRDR